MSHLRLSFSDVCGHLVGVLALTIMFVSLSTGSAHAAWPTQSGAFKKPDQVIGKMENFVDDGANSSRSVAYGLGGLGAVALGALAMFGRFNWTWLFSLFGGLSLVTLYNVGLNSLTGQTLN